jgi:undecaprenyl pyrophosphate phosphatase UppP
MLLKRLALMALIAIPMIAIYFLLREDTLAHLSETEDVIAALAIGALAAIIIEILYPRPKKDDNRS